MTWNEFCKIYDSSLTDKEIDFFLWNETAYPFSDLKMTVRQFLSAIRSYKNNIKRCDLCGWKLPYHKGYCINKKGF